MMIEVLRSLGQHEMIPVIAFLDGHQDGSEFVMVAAEISWLTGLQNGSDLVGNHVEEKFDRLTICDMKRFQSNQLPNKRPVR